MISTAGAKEENDTCKRYETSMNHNYDFLEKLRVEETSDFLVSYKSINNVCWLFSFFLLQLLPFD